MGWRGGNVSRQVTGSDLPRTYWQGRVPYEQEGCQGITFAREARSCRLCHKMVVAECRASEAHDSYSLDPDYDSTWASNDGDHAPLAGGAATERAVTSYSAAVERYRSWWECHLLENGGVDAFAQLVGVFADDASLRSSVWAPYLHAVYGWHTLTFPLSISSLTYFFWELLPAPVRASVELAPTDTHNRHPTGKGYDYTLQHPTELRYGQFSRGQYTLGNNDIWRSYRHSNLHCPCDTWSDCGADRDCGCKPQAPCPARALETVLSRGVPAHSLAEVQHICCDGDDWVANRQNNYDVQIGYWHYLSPGSGIFFNVGKTFATEWHETLNTDAILRLGCNWTMARPGRRLGGGDATHERQLNTWADMGLQCLRALGYDSVQFTHYLEGTLTKLEIVSLRDTHAQRDGCFDPQLSWMYRKGWNADEECRCQRPTSGRRRHWGHGLNCDADG